MIFSETWLHDLSTHWIYRKINGNDFLRNWLKFRPPHLFSKIQKKREVQDSLVQTTTVKIEIRTDLIR